jgi:hypothetical protein
VWCIGVRYEYCLLAKHELIVQNASQLAIQRYDMQIQLAISILLCCCVQCGDAVALDDTPLQNDYRLPRVADGRSAPTSPARRSMSAGLPQAPAMQTGADLPAHAPRPARRKALARVPEHHAGLGLR